MVQMSGLAADARHKNLEPLSVRNFSPADIPPLAGKTMLVTGANGGLGKQTAVALAQAGARVVLACHNMDRGKAALDGVAAVAAPDAAPVLVPVDLGSLESVHAAAEEVARRVESLDVVVNNAGIMATLYKETADGIEGQIGINHFGHFALVGRLLPMLVQAPHPRVVTVSSLMHARGKLDLSDLNFRRRTYRRFEAYADSKLANLLYTAELARRAERAGSPLVSVAAHPGVAGTDLFDPIVPTFFNARTAVRQMAALMANSAEHGAYSQLYAATMPDVRNNDYLGPTGFGGVRGPVARAQRSKTAWDHDLARALWERSVELTGVDYSQLR